jgi:hypothetical protein
MRTCVHVSFIGSLALLCSMSCWPAIAGPPLRRGMPARMPQLRSNLTMGSMNMQSMNMNMGSMNRNRPFFFAPGFGSGTGTGGMLGNYRGMYGSMSPYGMGSMPYSGGGYGGGMGSGGGYGGGSGGQSGGSGYANADYGNGSGNQPTIVILQLIDPYADVSQHVDPYTSPYDRMPPKLGDRVPARNR